ncbi:replicative DNA helicase [Alkalicoccus chagannorensis]|uniref:replicative DNA helicase n=1 Tax=Alkalicoccus chagannorensis TaxID=427072 RepID=UPI00040AFFDB|nr:replicative DNA helicase [Alkalicoccus chagannorensis]
MADRRELEESLLGSFFLEPSLIQESRIEPDMMQHVATKTIYEGMVRLREEGTGIDVMTLIDRVNPEVLDQSGGIEYLAQIAASVPTTSHFKHYEQRIIEHYKLEEARRAATQYINDVSEDNLHALKQRLDQVEEIRSTADSKSFRDVVLEVADDMHGIGVTTGHLTGLYDFDRMTGGLQQTDLIIVAARPSMGKTAFSLELASSQTKNGKTSHFFSLEMGAKQLVKRLISAQGNIDGAKWRDPERLFAEQDYQKAIYAMDELSKWDFRIHENDRTVADIRAKIRQAVNKEPDGDHIVIIDYLQLITGGGRFENRVQEVGYITRELKLLAKEMEIPIVLLSQLSRGVEQRQDKRPMMSDIRESGNVEQDADVIAFLYRDDYYNQESELKDIIEVIIAKQRNGPIGTAELAFVKEHNKFLNLESNLEEVPV